MDVNGISQLISGVGFPIACTIALFWYMTKQQENHKTETDSLKDAIVELKLAITTLIDKIGD